MIMLNIFDIPVACLTSNSLSETIGFLNTCKTTLKGAKKQLPTLYAYSIPFEAVYTKDGAIINYHDLQAYGRERTLLDWSMTDSDSGIGDAGQAYIENLELSASSDDFIKFTGTLSGYGSIVDVDLIYDVWAQDVGVYVDNGDNYVFVN